MKVNSFSSTFSAVKGPACLHKELHTSLKSGCPVVCNVLDNDTTPYIMDVCIMMAYDKDIGRYNIYMAGPGVQQLLPTMNAHNARYIMQL